MYIWFSFSLLIIRLIIIRGRVNDFRGGLRTNINDDIFSAFYSICIDWTRSKNFITSRTVPVPKSLTVSINREYLHLNGSQYFSLCASVYALALLLFFHYSFSPLVTVHISWLYIIIILFFLKYVFLEYFENVNARTGTILKKKKKYSISKLSAYK